MAEKNYVKLAQANITKPSQMPPKWRFLIYSRHKKGKTRFCISANDLPDGKILMLDAERGTDKYRNLDPDVWPINKWEDLADARGFLRTGKHKYTWVALDTMTKINNLALRYIMKTAEEANLDRRPGIVDRRDYNKSGELLKELIMSFDTLPMGVIYTAQERVQTLGDDQESDELAESSTYYVPDLPQGVRGALNSNVDVIGRLYVTKAQFKKGDDIVEKNQRRLWIGNHPMYDTGFRSEFDLPDVVKMPTVSKLTKLMLEGSA